ncbi:MAG: hypothetical protein IJY01_06220 [Clostridia bacterium]|nr:hypothetical protein [Clostridia bacterium]
MKKLLVLLLLMSIMLLSVLSFAACNGNTPDGDDDDKPDTPLTGLVLVRGGVAEFRVVIASGAGSEGRRAAGELVDALRKAGVEIADAIEDRDASAVSEREIIVGTGVKNRPEGCAVTAGELGDEGYLIRTVGERIVIAGGTPALTRSTVQKFISDYMKITDTTESVTDLALDGAINLLVPTRYDIEALKIAGGDISDFVIVCDKNDFSIYPNSAEALRNMLLAESGLRLDIVAPDGVPAGKKKILLTNVADAGDGGFRVRIAEGNMLVECAYPLLFAECLDNFAKEAISSKSGVVEFSQDYLYERHIKTVKYADFGAVGDGKTNDFFAIKAAHERVNATGQTLIPEGTVGKVFMIGKTWADGITVDGITDCQQDGTPYKAQSIPVLKDMDFTDASFIIDDTTEGIGIYARRQSHIFYIRPDIEPLTYKEGTKRPLSALSDNLEIKAGQKNIPWLTRAFENLPGERFHIILENSNKKDFIRFGSNQNSGYDRTDIILVDREGNVDAKTSVVFDFDTVTWLSVLPTADTAITISGGRFTNICAKCTDSSIYPDTKDDTWARGIKVLRPNTTVKNIDHQVTGEPNEKGYSYSSFLSISDTYNVTLKDSKLTGHQQYTVGTYDLAISDSLYVTVKGITQYRDIKDSKYWGINASNGSKCLSFEDCTISRIDAHCGFWNVDIKNCVLGLDLNVIGGGTLNIENVKRRTGDKFLKLRNDYGATFDGVINIKNCYLDGYETWRSDDGKFDDVKKYHKTIYLIRSDFTPDKTYNHPEYGASSYKEWDFGYTCYMPSEVNIDNFKYTEVSGRSFYVFVNVADSAFSKSLPNGGYQLTRLITYKNMPKPAICSDATCTKLRSIPIQAK